MSEEKKVEGPVPSLWTSISSHLQGLTAVLKAAALLVAAAGALFVAFEKAKPGPCDVPHEKQPLWCTAGSSSKQP